MAIDYRPAEIIKKSLSKSKIKKLVGKDFSLNKLALKTINTQGIIPKKQLSQVTLKVLKSYKKRFENGESKEEIGIDLLAERLQNTAMKETTDVVTDAYYGEFYEWLPSDSETPDPEHQLKYGEIFQIGKGEMPQDRYGCKCGMRILTDDETLDLDL